MRLACLFLPAVISLPAQIPPGFTPLFNGKDLSGWHISQSNHHGNTTAWAIRDGVVTVTQDTPGNGGILLTDREYGDFEISLEINPDFGCDGGLFLRSTEKGEAYQVMLDYLEGGSIGGIYGERLPEVNKDNTGQGERVNRDWQKHWRAGQWNRLRARIEGAAPHIQVWLNDVKIVDWQDSANHAIGGRTTGMIALQAHRSDPKNPRWKAGGYHRYRYVAIRELP
jgi:hypothetical protein